jgi:hypothetical protein
MEWRIAFGAALSALAILGVIHPIKMLPLPLLQLVYKLIWLSMVAFPLWSKNQLNDPETIRLARIFFAVNVDRFHHHSVAPSA